MHSLNQILWNQFGASIEMLENAIAFCPEHVWDDERKFWYNAYHCLFFLDYYSTLRAEEFNPPPPFDQSEFEDRMPDRTYTKAELLTYVEYCREKCRGLIFGLTEESSQYVWKNMSGTMVYPIVELILDNMRHVQHHAAQLNLLLRQSVDDAPDWVARVSERN